MDASQKTLWVGNLPENITEELLYELFLQAGPLEKVYVPKDKRYAFIQFKHEESVPYSVRIMDGISLFGKLLNMRARTVSVQDSSNHPTPRFSRNSQDSWRGENNNQNRGSSHDNSYSKNYDQYSNASPSSHHGNNSKNFSNRQPWLMSKPHQALPNMQPSSGRRVERRHQHDNQHSRSSHTGDYKTNFSYRHEPYKRY